MKEYIPWNDIFVFGGISLFTVVSVLLAVFTKQEWAWWQIIILLTIPGSIIGLSIFIVLQKWLSRPDYITKHNTAVWTTQIGWPLKVEIERVIDYLVKSKNAPWKKTMFIDILDGLKIRWHDKPINLISRQGWKIKNAAFVQKGNQIEIVRTVDIGSINLFSALIHVYREIGLKQKPDYEYKDEIWDIVPKLIEGWKK